MFWIFSDTLLRYCVQDSGEKGKRKRREKEGRERGGRLDSVYEVFACSLVLCCSAASMVYFWSLFLESVAGV